MSADRIAYLRRVSNLGGFGGEMELRACLREALDLLQAAEAERDTLRRVNGDLRAWHEVLRARVAELERLPAQLRAEVVT